MSKNAIRRSGAKIMASLIMLLGSLAYIMVLAVINGSLGFVCAMSVTLFGAVGAAKALGEAISLSYSAIIALAIGCGVLRGLLRYIEQYSNHYIAFRLLAVLRDKIFGALRTLCPAKLESKQKGSIIAMITSDIETLEVFYAHTISPVCIAVIVSLAVFIFVGKISSWYLALTALVGYILVGIVLPLVSSGKLKESGVHYRAEFAGFNAYFLDSIKGIKDIVLNNSGESRKAEVNRRSDVLLAETRKMKNNITKASAATELTVSLVIIAALAVGIILVSKGELSLGRMIIGVTAVFGSFGPVIAISALSGNLTQTFASGDRVLDLLAEKPAVKPVKNGEKFSFDRLEVSDMSFSYDKKNNVLSDICLSAKKGEIVGIVGESGCGKSTLLKLLLRFCQKDSGTIGYNGIDIDRIDEASLLDNVTMVSQVTYLFDETIEENLRIAKPNATQAEIENACKMASVHDFIMTRLANCEDFVEKMPEKWNSMIGENGSELSGGERQRISIARAFLKDAPIILMDEATASLDVDNESLIQESISKLIRNKTVLVIAHRMRTVDGVDKIVVLKDGKVAEQGSPEELRKANGIYKHMAEMQLSSDQWKYR